MFLVLEGADGSGKSTQVSRVAQRLRDRGREVVETFEPGATRVGAALRALVLDPGSGPDPTTETLLLAADRARHVEEVVRPALERGAVVISDRFVPSSLVYQGVVRGIGLDAVTELNRFATGGLEPDVVVVLDLPTPAARGRLGEPDRMEAEGVAFAAAVRDAYLDLARRYGWRVVDAGAEVDVVTDRIVEVLG